MSEQNDAYEAYQDYRQERKPAAGAGKKSATPFNSCPDCGNTISKRALSCPHCGWHRLYKQWVFLTMLAIWSIIISAASILAIIPFLK